MIIPIAGRVALLRRLHLRQLAGSVKDVLLELPCRTVSLDDAIRADTSVTDGLSEIQQAAANCKRVSKLPHLKAGQPALEDNQAVHEAGMLSEAAVRDISMPDVQNAAVRQGRLISCPNTRTIAFNFRTLSVGSLEPFRTRAPEVMDGARFLITAPAIRATERVARFPHRRKSIDVETMKESERIGFLHEAETLKNIPPDRAELLAVFRHVPIEMISRLRFLAGRKEILYSIPSGPKRTQTRVHDMAVVRDNTNQDVHIIPHRMQSRQVSLTDISNQRGI